MGKERDVQYYNGLHADSDEYKLYYRDSFLLRSLDSNSSILEMHK
jgi:hypothetical protein